jgi:cell division septum initiation protein DivIVA
LAAVDEQPEAEAAQAREALRTEAALLRILRDDNLAGSRQAPRADAVDELRARVAAAEEELAEARFEIGQLRDALSRAGGPTLRAAPRPEPVEALAEATAELRALYELLRAERAEIAALGERMRADAERMLHDVRARADQLREQARADAKRIRDDADAAAHEAVAAARAEAVALTRNAMVTVDGLRRLAQEHGSGDEPRG